MGVLINTPLSQIITGSINISSRKNLRHACFFKNLKSRNETVDEIPQDHFALAKSTDLHKPNPELRYK